MKLVRCAAGAPVPVPAARSPGSFSLPHAATAIASATPANHLAPAR